MRSRVLRIAAALLLVGSCVAALPWAGRYRFRVARRQWKNDALPAIANWAADKKWRAEQVDLLTRLTNDQPVLAEPWLTDKFILMQNGEWLVYRSHCSKEAPHTVNDIFLARGSDGNWYYSTFHFCVRMVALLGEQETQPPNLAMFAHEYNLRRFDGRSDECLKETRSFPASWVEKKTSGDERTP
jgi:hypothetical protein